MTKQRYYGTTIMLLDECLAAKSPDGQSSRLTNSTDYAESIAPSTRPEATPNNNGLSTLMDCGIATSDDDRNVHKYQSLHRHD